MREHPVLISLDVEEVKAYLYEAVDYYHRASIDLDLHYGVITLEEVEKGLQQRLRESCNPPIAGLLSAYARRAIAIVIRCPLCRMNNHTDSGMCRAAREKKGSDCIAIEWCISTLHVHRTPYNAYDFVKKHCEKVGVQDMEWLPRISALFGRAYDHLNGEKLRKMKKR